MRFLLRAAAIVAVVAGAAIVLRTSRDATVRGISLVEALVALPVTVRNDLDGVRADVRAALLDGRRAAGERRLELETETET